MLCNSRTNILVIENLPCLDHTRPERDVVKHLPHTHRHHVDVHRHRGRVAGTGLSIARRGRGPIVVHLLQRVAAHKLLTRPFPHRMVDHWVVPTLVLAMRCIDRPQRDVLWLNPASQRPIHHIGWLLNIGKDIPQLLCPIPVFLGRGLMQPIHNLGLERINLGLASLAL